MKPEHQRKSKLNTQKIIDCALDNAQFWVGNTRYFSHKDIFKLLVLAALEQTSVEDIATMQRETSSGVIPSEDTIMRILHQKYDELVMAEIEEQISVILQQMAMKLPFFRHRRSRVVLALDLHDEEFFGKALIDDEGRRITMVGPKKDKSAKSRLVFRTGTISIVKWGKHLSNPITIAFAVNFKGQPREEIVKRLMELIAPVKLRVRTVLMDGGFASREVFQHLNSLRMDFIARGRYSSKKEYPIDDVFTHQMYRPGEGNYNVFATLEKTDDQNILLLSSAELKKEEIFRLYKHRFRIENTYRHARVPKIRTSTRNLQLRWIFWGISLLLELIWEIIRYINEISHFKKYLSRQKRINRIMKAFIIQYLANAKYRIG
ncbi:MAG: transposase [Candidatus Heimdallarchaeota archaeon]|nr:transposase [Candidatus Heimdallarchaeota archaeon]